MLYMLYSDTSVVHWEQIYLVNDPSCGCPLEDDMHYLLECPLYTNARMQECNYLLILHCILLCQLKTYSLALII
jgi:hypothetical protein